MLTNVFFPDVPGVRVDRIWRKGPTMHLDVVTTRRSASCPVCQRRSRRVHNHYERTIADLSMVDPKVRFSVTFGANECPAQLGRQRP